jgi:2-phospho-L-lactate guanylyltransferase
MTTAVVPVKAHPAAKARLSHVLMPGERVALVQRLLAHVVDVLTTAGLRTIVVAAGEVDTIAGVEVVREPVPGLNRALAAVLEQVERPLVVPCDLPWLEAGDVERLLATNGQVVIAPTRDLGTGALLMREKIRPAFGPASALAHARAARRAALSARVVRLSGFARDLDDEASLVVALARSPALASASWASAWRRPSSYRPSRPA